MVTGRPAGLSVPDAAWLCHEQLRTGLPIAKACKDTQGPKSLLCSKSGVLMQPFCQCCIRMSRSGCMSSSLSQSPCCNMLTMAGHCGDSSHAHHTHLLDLTPISAC